MDNKQRIIYLVVAIAVIVGAILYLQGRKSNVGGGVDVIEITSPAPEERRAEKSDQYLLAKEITTPDALINADNFSISDQVGKKVVLVDFWTYSCINCQRTLPYLNAWHNKYKDYGLEIVGVHTPEFEFEKEFENVLRATEKYSVEYPVVLDNDYSTWRAYNNRYWPRKYIIDIDGFIVYDHIGEGAYQETERKIQELLKERNKILGIEQEIPGGIVDPSDMVETDFSQDRTPEIYFGAGRNEYLANGTKGSVGVQTFNVPQDLDRDKLYLGGEWNIQKEFSQNVDAGARIVLPYRAKNVYFVADTDRPVAITIFKDGQQIAETVIDGAGTYQVVSDMEYEEHILEIRIERGGLKAFTFTFG